MSLRDAGQDPLVLNLASCYCPGGGVVKGCRAQEEELFRCTNYCLCTNRSLYPIKSDEFIITDHVSIIKDENYNRLRDYREFDFIAVAAVRKPPLIYHAVPSQYMEDEDRKLMEDKIDAIFRYAVFHERGTLLLGALGCGAYGNPTELVRDMFQNALNKYRNYFDHITFAVLSLNKNTNFKIFSSLH